MASIEREVENALLNVVSGIGGVNFYTSERSVARTIPSVTVQTQIGSEELVPFSGVFKTPTTITYVARADTTARADFDAKFYDILEQLYRDPDLAGYLTTNSNITFYVAKVTGDTPAVTSQNRTWSRAMTLDITATAAKIFSPLNISGLSLWLKADAGVTLSGSNVTGWADQSGNGNNASANSGQEPTFVSSFLNAKPAIEFNGTTQVMQIADANNLDFLNISVFVVLKYIDQGTGNNVIYIKNADSPENPAMYGLVGTSSSSSLSFSMNVGGWTDYPTSINLTNSISRVISMTYDGTDQNVYSNGSLSDTFSIGGDIATSTGLLQIGGYNKSFDASEYFYGQIAEIIMYNRAVTGTERQQVEKYLNSKYAIY